MKNARIERTEYSTRFVRSFEKLPPDIKKKSDKKEILFRLDTFTPQLRTHKLNGIFKDYWSYSVDYQYRVVFHFINAHKALFFDIGSHRIYDKSE